MTFRQVLSLWTKEAIKIWDEMPSIEKWIFVGLIVSTLLLIISFWRVL